MLGSSPNLVWAWFSTRGIQKSGSRDPKNNPSAYADRQTPKIKNGPLDLKTGIDKVQDPRNPKTVVPRAKKQPLDLRRQTNTKNKKRSGGPETRQEQVLGQWGSWKALSESRGGIPSPGTTFLHTTRSNPYGKKGAISRKPMKCASIRGTRGTYF